MRKLLSGIGASQPGIYASLKRLPACHGRTSMTLGGKVLSKLGADAPSHNRRGKNKPAAFEQREWGCLLIAGKPEQSVENIGARQA